MCGQSLLKKKFGFQRNSLQRWNGFFTLEHSEAQLAIRLE